MDSTTHGEIVGGKFRFLEKDAPTDAPGGRRVLRADAGSHQLNVGGYDGRHRARTSNPANVRLRQSSGAQCDNKWSIDDELRP